MDISAQVPAESGQAVTLGKQPPFRLRKVPLFIGIWAAMGPGVVWAAMAQGSGEIIWWPQLTAKYGPYFLGLLLPACLMQYFVNQEIVRYTATTGEGIFQGFARIHRYFSWFMWALMVISFAWFGGYASSGGTALFALTNFPAGWSAQMGSLFWAYATILFFVGVIVLGKVVYQVIEKFMTVIAGITVLGLLAAISRPEVMDTAGSFFAAYFNPVYLLGNGFPSNWQSKDMPLILTGISSAGMGGYFNLMYSYWIRDKGHSMAKYMGRVTSPVTGTPETISESGFVFEDTQENKQEYKKWISYLRIDNAIGVFINLATVSMMAWLSWSLLLPKGEVPEGWMLAVVQSRFFEFAWGPIGRAFFLIIAAAFLVDTWLGVTDAISRMHADFFTSNFGWAKRFGFRKIYYIAVACLVVVSSTTMVFTQPGPLLLIQGVLSYLAMAIYCPFLIYLNYVLIPKAYPNWVRPTNWALIGITTVSALYLVIIGWYIMLTLGIMKM